MSRFTTLFFAVALAAAAAGCRQSHLGSSTGEVYRAALEAQRQSEADPVAPLDDGDAKKVLATHHKTGGKSDKSDGSSTSSSTTSSSSGPTSGGMWPGASGNIQLDAK